MPECPQPPVRRDEHVIRAEVRREAARLVHDELGQLLTSVKLELAWAAGALRDEPLCLADRLQAAIGLVDISILTVQRLSERLHPGEAVPFGEALRRDASLFQYRTGIRCRVVASRSRMPIDPTGIAALQGIVAEALTNVARHSEAGAVRISLRQRRRAVTLTIADNGRGIPADTLADPESQGFRIMRERMQDVGGSLRIGPGSHGGTRVEACIPEASSGGRNRPA